MEKYFYKIVDNIDFVWKIEAIINDPYKQNEIDFGHYACNKRLFNPYIFESLEDFEKRELLTGYKEIKADLINEEQCYFDKTIGLLHKDEYWTNLYALRQVNCLDKMAPIVFGNSTDQEDLITENDRENYSKLMSCGVIEGKEIYTLAFSYFKSLWEFDEFFANTNLGSLEKFLPTLELQAIYLKYDKEENADIASIVFRPSWDPEHGLAILLDLNTKEIKLYED
jgi:hypothetical protein